MQCILLFFIFLAIFHSLQDLSSLTRDQTLAQGNGSTESYPLDHQAIPMHKNFSITRHPSTIPQQKQTNKPCCFYLNYLSTNILCQA